MESRARGARWRRGRKRASRRRKKDAERTMEQVRGQTQGPSPRWTRVHFAVPIRPLAVGLKLRSSVPQPLSPSHTPTAELFLYRSLPPQLSSMPMSALKDPLLDIRTTSDKKIGSGRWLSLHEVQFSDPSGTPHGWEVCRRVKPASALPDPDPDAPSVDGKR